MLLFRLCLEGLLKPSANVLKIRTNRMTRILHSKKRTFCSLFLTVEKQNDITKCSVRQMQAQRDCQMCFLFHSLLFGVHFQGLLLETKM